jgi:hypothetical protein
LHKSACLREQIRISGTFFKETALVNIFPKSNKRSSFQTKKNRQQTHVKSPGKADPKILKKSETHISDLTRLKENASWSKSILPKLIRKTLSVSEMPSQFIGKQLIY